MYCHICNEKMNGLLNSIMKCKLCCDGLEQEFCFKCADLYFNYKRPENGFVRRSYFKRLQARRMVAVKRTRFKLINGGK